MVRWTDVFKKYYDKANFTESDFYRGWANRSRRDLVEELEEAKLRVVQLEGRFQGKCLMVIRSTEKVLSECQELPDGPLVANVSHHPLVPRQVNNAAELLGSEEHLSEEAEPSKAEDNDTPDQSGSENSPLASGELSRALSAEDLAFFEGDIGHLHEGLPSDGHILREGPEVMEASPQGDQSPLITHDKRTNEGPESLLGLGQ